MHYSFTNHKQHRLKEGREPPLPLTISSETFDKVGEYFDSLNYKGPAALACDDSKLLAALRLYWNPSEKSHFLVGAVSGPIRVIDPDSVDSILNDLSIEKGTKMRLWTVQIPLPKMRPVVIAAIPIGNNLKAPELHRFHEKIINGLLGVGIHIVSYSCDGTKMERLVQKTFADGCSMKVVFQVDSPKPGLCPISIQIPVPGLSNDCPIALIQDAKHGLKTARNNLFSGATLLPLGNYIANFRKVRDIAFEDGSPLYHRDVEKLDRQDNNAALRLFSAPMLDYLVTKHPDEISLIVYLFVFGELIDAYQNRHITHDECIKMVLRAHYFINMWKTYIMTIPAYRHPQYFLSREYVDIISFLVNGFLSLVVIYRDHVEGIHPLLPWLHSTEPC